MNSRQLLTQLNTVQNALLTYRRVQNTSWQVRNLLRQTGWAAGYMQDIQSLNGAMQQIRRTLLRARRRIR